MSTDTKPRSFLRTVPGRVLGALVVGLFFAPWVAGCTGAELFQKFAKRAQRDVFALLLREYDEGNREGAVQAVASRANLAVIAAIGATGVALVLLPRRRPRAVVSAAIFGATSIAAILAHLGVTHRFFGGWTPRTPGEIGVWILQGTPGLVVIALGGTALGGVLARRRIGIPCARALAVAALLLSAMPSHERTWGHLQWGLRGEAIALGLALFLEVRFLPRPGEEHE